MGNIVIVLPNDLGSDRHRSGAGIEGEIIDGHLGFAGACKCAIDDAAYRRTRRERAEAVANQRHVKTAFVAGVWSRSTMLRIIPPLVAGTHVSPPYPPRLAGRVRARHGWPGQAPPRLRRTLLSMTEFARCEPCRHALTSSLSVMASGWVPCLTATVVTPSTVRSLSSGTRMGPGAGAVPGAGCGKAVERAVWNVTAPSTFCMIWWMWPLSTVTEPKRLTRSSAWAESSVPQPQFAATVQSGIWANSTIGVEVDLPFKSSASHAS